MRREWIYLALLVGLLGVFWASEYWGDFRYGYRVISAPFDSNILVVTAVRVPYTAMYGRPTPQGVLFATFSSNGSTKYGFAGVESSGIFSSVYESVVGYSESDGNILVFAHVPSKAGWYEVDIGDVNDPMSRSRVGNLLITDSRLSEDAGVSNTVDFVTHMYRVGNLLVVEGRKDAQDVVLVYKYPVSGGPIVSVEHAPNLFVGRAGDWLFVGIKAASLGDSQSCIEQVNVDTGAVYCDSLGSSLSIADLSGRSAFIVRDGTPYFATASVGDGSLVIREFKFSTPSGGRQYGSVSFYKSTTIPVSDLSGIIGFVAGPNDYLAFVRIGSTAVRIYHISPVDLSIVHEDEWSDSSVLDSPYYVFGRDPNGLGVSVGYLVNNGGRFYFYDAVVPDGNYLYSENVSVVKGEVNADMAVVEYRICNISDVNMPGVDVARVYLRVSDQNSGTVYYYTKYLPFEVSAGSCKEYTVEYTPGSLTFAYPSSDGYPKEFNSSYTYEARIYVLHEQPYTASVSGFSDYASQQISFTGGPISIGSSGGSGSSVAVPAAPSTVTLPPHKQGVQPAAPVAGVSGSGVNYGVVVFVIGVLALLAYVARAR